MNCGIIQDLLPLYHDGVCSPESRAEVEEHLKTCPDCRAVLAAMDAPLPEEKKTAPDDVAAMRSLSRAWEKGKRRAWWKGALLAVAVCAVILVAAYCTKGFADCAYPLLAYNYSGELSVEAESSFSKSFYIRSLLTDDQNAFSVVVNQISGPYQVVILADGEIIYDSGETSKTQSHQITDTNPETEYTVTVQNLGDTPFTGRLLISAYYEE